MEVRQGPSQGIPDLETKNGGSGVDEANGSSTKVNDKVSEQDQLETQQRSDRMYIDLGSSITHMLTESIYYKRYCHWADRDFLEPSLSYSRFLLPPSEMRDLPETGLCCRYLHTSINRIRHPVTAVTWSPEGRRLITASQNGEFTLWSSFGFISDSSISGHDSAVRTMTWTKNQDWLASGDHEGNLKIWTLQLRPVKVIKAHNNSLRALSFSPTDKKLCSGSDDLKIKIWDFATGKEERVLSGHGFDVKSVAWHPTKSLILSGSRDNLCKLWSPENGKELATITGHKNTVNHVAWNPLNGYWFVSTSRDKTIKMYDLRMIRKESPCVHTMEAHGSEVYSAAWHPMYEEVLATGGYDGSLYFWILSGKKSKPHVQAAVPAAHEGAIWTMDWHPAGHLLCTGSNDRTCKFWSRMRPGSTEDDLYRGYLRDISELDVLKSLGRQPPPGKLIYRCDWMINSKVPEIDHQKEQQLQRQVQSRKRNISRLICQKEQEEKMKAESSQILQHLANVEIPTLGKIGETNARIQGGLSLCPAEVSVHKRTRYYADPSTDVVATYPTGISGAQATGAHAERKKKPRENISSSADTELGGGGSRPRASESSDGRQVRTKPAIDPTKLPGPRKTGFVRMYDENKGFGFIRPHDGTPDLFAHSSDVEKGFGHNGEQRLEKGDIVVYRPERGENKITGEEQYKARNIVLIEHDPEMAKSVPQQQSNLPSSQQHISSPASQKTTVMPGVQIQEQQMPDTQSSVPIIPPELLQLFIQQANDPIQLARTLAMHNLTVEQLQLAIQQHHLVPQQQFGQQQGANQQPQHNIHASYMNNNMGQN